MSAQNGQCQYPTPNDLAVVRARMTAERDAEYRSRARLVVGGIFCDWSKYGYVHEYTLYESYGLTAEVFAIVQAKLTELQWREGEHYDVVLRHDQNGVVLSRTIKFKPEFTSFRLR